jgi:Flp pilus assembly protein TadD
MAKRRGAVVEGRRKVRVAKPAPKESGEVLRLIELGAVCLGQRRFGEAIGHLERALRLQPDHAVAHNRLGIALASAGRLDEALARFARAVELDPRMADARNNLGNTLRLVGRLEEAAPHLLRALELKPDYFEARLNLAMMHVAGQRWAEAEASFRAALELRPHDAATHHFLAVVLAAQERWEEAVAEDRASLRLRPDAPEVHANLAASLAALECCEESIAHCRAALRLRPSSPTVYSDVAKTLREQGRADEALVALFGAVPQWPDSADIHMALGTTFLENSQPYEAVLSLQRAVELRPDDPDIHTNLYAALWDQGRLGEAIYHTRRALELQPDSPWRILNHGLGLTALGEPLEGLAAIERAARMKPDSPDVQHALGQALARVGRLDEALACYEKALELKPDFPEVRQSRGLAWIAQGDLARGWPEFEWRWRCPGPPRPPFPQPYWDGSNLAGKTILLHTEQGFGDAIQFIRFAPLVKRQGCRVMLRCTDNLARLLATCPGIDQVVLYGADVPPFDVQITLMSLPAVLGTTLETIPAEVPYLSVHPEWVERRRRDLASISGFRIGIVWQGNRYHRSDLQRSIPLAQFEPLAKLPGVRLISLQKGAGTEQVAALKGRFPVIELADLGAPPIVDYYDTAAIVQNLDMVIMIDSSVAHLAGALAKPVWVALPFAAEWRWMTQREDTPWYPTMRLFRQPTPGDWPSVFERMAATLRPLLAHSPADPPAAAPRPTPSAR